LNTDNNGFETQSGASLKAINLEKRLFRPIFQDSCEIKGGSQCPLSELIIEFVGV
jgi:hypothetical protein